MIQSDTNSQHSGISGRQKVDGSRSQHGDLRSPDTILILSQVLGPDTLASLHLKVLIIIMCISVQESTIFRNNILGEGILWKLLVTCQLNSPVFFLKKLFVKVYIFKSIFQS